MCQARACLVFNGVFVTAVGVAVVVDDDFFSLFVENLCRRRFAFESIWYALKRLFIIIINVCCLESLLLPKYYRYEENVLLVWHKEDCISSTMTENWLDFIVFEKETFYWSLHLVILRSLAHIHHRLRKNQQNESKLNVERMSERIQNVYESNEWMAPLIREDLA